MKRFFILMILIVAVTAMEAAKPRTSLKVYATKKQHVTGFGGACCDGAMKPFGENNACVGKLYGKKSKIGLNILRMEISPSFTGDNWGDYDWNGSLPSAKAVKNRGGIVFGTPWSPPGEYKTNGTAQGGKVNPNKDDDPQNQRGKLREDCYELFFPWLNTFLGWMHDHGVDVDAVSVQNEPDWWVNYSGCLYEPSEQVTLVKNYAWMLDRERFPGVRLISAEPLGYREDYFTALLNDETCREQVDIFAGHIYGHMPLQYIKPVANKALPYGKEIWMTEHSVTDNTGALPTWPENLIFAEELNECMLAGCTGYIYWYLRAHWSFCGTGETEYGSANKKDELLPRAFVMSHFAKNVTGSTRLATSQDESAGREREEILQNEQFSAYIKGDSIIVMAINAREATRDVKITLPENVNVVSGTLWLSTGNETANLCQKSDLDITEPTNEYLYEMPAQSLSTFIFMIDHSVQPIEEEITIDFTDFTEGTNLENTNVDNVYYNLDSDNGDGYDASEDCLVISTTTDMANIADAAPGSTDIKKKFAGMILEVNGSGILKINCQTLGNSALNVMIGDGEAETIVQNEQGVVTIAYNVEEPTHVYLYATTTESLAPARAAATENAVKIYSLEIIPGATGISNVNINDNDNVNLWYTLDGRRLNKKPTQKGVYIMNGRKVVIK